MEQQIVNPKRGRPAFKPTDAHRLKVTRMVEMGIHKNDIAKGFGISPKALRKHFREELKASSVEATFKVIETLYEMATCGNNTSASIFWARARGGFQTKPGSSDRAEKVSDPAPPSTIVVLNNDGAPVEQN